MSGVLNPCSHCGLPARGSYCCYGCELAAQVAAEAGDDHAHLFGTLTFTLVLTMMVMMASLFLYAEDVFDIRGDTEMAWLRTIYRWGSWVLATPVMLLAGVPLFMRAARRLRQRRLSIDALIALGAFAAYGLSVYNLWGQRGGLYFESASAALVLATFGRYLEAVARSKASRTLGPLLEVSKSTVRVRGSDGGWRQLSSAEIEPDMSIEVDAGEVVPVDVRLDVDAEVDLAVLTGESRPVTRVRGQTVPAGAVPWGVTLAGRALGTSRQSALERLGDLARDLSAHPTAVLMWADRFATVLTPVIAVVATAVLVYWTRAVSFDKGVVSALAVVLAACPCTYAIATPLVHWMMLQRAFRHGVLVRSVAALEALARVRTVAFDKTGTLARPELAVSSEALAIDGGEVHALVQALESGSAHPVARALRAHTQGAEPAAVERRRFVPGRGVEAIDAHGRRLTLGPGSDGCHELVRDGTVLARFVLDEALRPDAAPAASELRAAGFRLLVLSGDEASRVERIARELDIEAHAGLSPEDKLEHLGRLGDDVAMVGDGVNDLPSLAGRLTGFTLGGAAQSAQGVAQVTLLRPDLRLVPWTLTLARRGVRLIQWMIGCSTAYNLAFVALAAAGALKPVWAGLSMLIASLIAMSFAVALGGGGEHADERAVLDLTTVPEADAVSPEEHPAEPAAAVAPC